MDQESPGIAGERGRYGWVAAGIVAAVAFMLVWNQVEMRRGPESPFLARAGADFATRIWVVERCKLPPPDSRKAAKQIVDSIVGALAESPDDPGLWIRMDVLRAEAGLDLREPPGAPKRPHGRPAHSFSLIASLYAVSDIRRDWPGEHAKLVEGLDLGPLGTLLAAKVAERSGDPGRAARMRDRLYERAVWWIVVLMVVLGLLVLAGVVGVVVWIGHFADLRAAGPGPPTVSVPVAPMVLVFALYPFLGQAVSRVLGAALIGEQVRQALRHNPGIGLGAALLMTGIIGVLCIWIASRLLKRANLSLAAVGMRGAPWGRNLVRGVLGWFAALPLVGMATAISLLLFRGTRVPTPPNPIAEALISASGPVEIVLLFVLACAAAPLFEEFLFRGALYGAMRTRWGMWPAIVGSAAVFALVHPQLPLGLLPIFALGAILAYLRERTGSLVPSMVVHAANNGVALLAAALLLR
jgi:membrane protease YdiL (CAAX protease family)